MVRPQLLGRQAYCFRHREIDGQLNHSEMMFRAADCASHRDQILQAQMVAGVRMDAESVPCRAAVESNDTALYLVFQRGECILHHVEKPWPAQDLQLLFRIVEIINVNDCETEVVSAAFNLILQISRSKTVATADDIAGAHHTALEVLAVEKLAISVFGRGRTFLERYVAAFGANDDLLAFDGAHRDRIANRVAKGALRPLAAVIDRGIEQIDSFLECRAGSCPVVRVFGVVALAEISAKPKRRNERAAGELAIKVVAVRFGKSFAKAIGAFERRTTLNQSRRSYRRRSLCTRHCESLPAPRK